MPLPSLGTIVGLLLLAPVSALPADDAFAALQQGRVDQAQKILQAGPRDARSHQLLCRVFYAQDQFNEAVRECEAAVSLAPNDAASIDWLGRAYGLKAGHVNPLSAFSLAKKVRATFERAVQADPNNLDAAVDLGQFLVDAPSIAGGDIDAARRLAGTMAQRSPAKAHRLLAQIAAKAHDNATAEREYKAAIEAGRAPDSYTDLALFYQVHNQPDQALAAVREAIRADRSHGPALVDAASILTDAHRAPELAERALRDYLASPAQTDEAPAFRVHLKLGKLLAAHGDQSGATREYAAALALAPNYGPAREAMKGA
jgi:tetratricopeptide (TPR) repeat protein